MKRVIFSERMKRLFLYVGVYPAVFFISLVLGAYWTFPYERVRDYIVQEVERGGSVQLEIASLSPSWLTGIQMEGVRVTNVPADPSKLAAPLALSEVEARISLLSLLLGTTEVSFDVATRGGGTLTGVYAQNDEMTRLEAELANLDLQHIGPLHDTVGLPIAGKASGKVDMTIGAEAANTQGTVDLTVRDVGIGDGETPLVIDGMGAGVTLERMNLGTLELQLAAERGEATIQRLSADGEHAELRGAGTLNLALPLRRTSMDVLARIKFKDAYRESSPRMGALFSLLEMNPAVRPARTPDGGLQWRIAGSLAGRVRMVPSGQAPMPE